MTVSIRHATPRDAALLETLEQACALSPRSRTVLETELSSPAYTYFLADGDGVTVGYVGVGVFAGEAHIMTVGVVPAWRHRQVGRALVQQVFDWCVASGVSDVTLEVGSRNVAARALYDRCGFRTEGVRAGYYPDGDDAVIMWKRGL